MTGLENHGKTDTCTGIVWVGTGTRFAWEPFGWERDINNLMETGKKSIPRYLFFSQDFPRGNIPEDCPDNITR